MATSTGGILGGSLIDLIDASSKAYSDLRLQRFNEDLLKAQANQLATFNQITRDSNIGATTASPVLYVTGQGQDAPNDSKSMNNALLIGAVVLAAVLVLK
jgi:hypothetical protein